MGYGHRKQTVFVYHSPLLGMGRDLQYVKVFSTPFLVKNLSQCLRDSVIHPRDVCSEDSACGREQLLIQFLTFCKRSSIHPCAQTLKDHALPRAQRTECLTHLSHAKQGWFWFMSLSSVWGLLGLEVLGFHSGCLASVSPLCFKVIGKRKMGAS